MATQTVVTYTCDMPIHGQNSVEATEREVPLQVGSRSVTMDLCPSCWRTFIQSVEPYLEAGSTAPRLELERPTPLRRARGNSAASRGQRPGTSRSKRTKSPQEIREWARSQGMPVADRGRIPASLQQAYAAR